MLEKRLAEINQRKIEIRTLLETQEDVNLAEVESEIQALETEQRSIEGKKEVAEKIETVESRNIQKPKELKTMEFTQETIASAPEFRSAFLKNLQGKALNEVEQRALTTASNSAGAAVPTTTLNTIVDKLRQSSVLFPLVKVSYIPGNVSIVVANAKNAAGWKTEGADGTPADDTVTKVNLAGYELIKLVEISAAASSMTIDAFESYIAEEIGRQLGIAVENAILNGDGDGEPTGILGGITWGSGNSESWANNAVVDYDDLINGVALLPTLYHPNAVFVMNRKTLFGGVRKIKDDQKQPIFIYNAQDSFAGTIFGYKVIVNDYIGDDIILFGDFGQYYMNFAQQPTIETSIEAGFRSGKKVFRGLAVADGKPANTEAFVKIYKALS
jgi:HK97 family phage major capsid protein